MKITTLQKRDDLLQLKANIFANRYKQLQFRYSNRYHLRSPDELIIKNLLNCLLIFILNIKRINKILK